MEKLTELQLREKIDERLTHLVGVANRSRPGQVTHVLADIKELLDSYRHSLEQEIRDDEFASICNMIINKLKSK